MAEADMSMTREIDGDGLGDGDFIEVDDRMKPETLAEAVQEALVDPKWSRRYLRDRRTWKARRTRVTENWDDLYEPLTDAYMRHRYPAPQSSTSVPAPEASSTTDTMEGPNHDDLKFTITAVDLYSLSETAEISRREDQLTATAIVEAGYLGNSPNHPSVVISLRTLELYTTIRRRKASMSFEAFAKVLCDLYMVRFQPFLFISFTFVRLRTVS